MMNSINCLIEPIGVSDEPLLWEMLYLAVYVPSGASAPDENIVHTPELSRYVKDWGKENDCGVKALITGCESPIGAAWMRLLTGENRGFGYVDDETPELGIAVLEKYRGKGVGTILLEGLLEHAADKHSAVTLSVYCENPAINLYQRFGFEVVNKKDSSLTMKKVLTRKKSPSI